MSAPRPLWRPVGLTPGDHVAWAVDGPSVHDAALLPYLEEGLTRAERLVVVADGEGPVGEPWLHALPDADALVDQGQLQAGSTEQTYGPLLVGEVWQQVAQFSDQAERALADGFTGLRVWADVTPLAADPRWLESLLDYETVVESAFRCRPTTGLCAVDVTRAGDAWARLASRHRQRRPWQDTPGLTVELYDGVVRLVGEADFGNLAELRDNLASVRRVSSGPLCMDLSDLDFLDMAGTRVLLHFVDDVAAGGRGVELTGVRGLPARALSLFDLPRRAQA